MIAIFIEQSLGLEASQLKSLTTELFSFGQIYELERGEEYEKEIKHIYLLLDLPFHQSQKRLVEKNTTLILKSKLMILH